MSGITAPNPLRRLGPRVTGLAPGAPAACDGSSNAGSPGVANVASSSASTSFSPSNSASHDPLAFSRCMRAHGVTDFPDAGPHGGPGGRGGIDLRGRIRVMRRPRRAWPPTARTAAAIIATAAVAVLAAACSGSPSSTGSGSSSNAGAAANSKALAYAQCARSHGVPDFPDPDSSGGFNKTTLAQLAASNSRYQAATQTCGHLLPNGGLGRTPAEVRQEWNGMLNFARCMHSHGVPNWPDPTPYPPRPSDPTFILPASIQPIPQVISKMDECLRLVPNNQVLGHIDNNSWQAVQQAMAGS